MSVQALKALGEAEAIAFDISPDRIERALVLGVDRGMLPESDKWMPSSETGGLILLDHEPRPGRKPKLNCSPAAKSTWTISSVNSCCWNTTPKACH